MIKQDPGVLIELAGDPELYLPGGTISGRYRLKLGESTPEVQFLEWSIAWTTEGKGDEDNGIHVEETIRDPEGGALRPENWRRFVAILPLSPLSYDGLIVKILWRVRVRAGFGKKREWIGELPFRLGDIDRGREKDDHRP